MSGYEFIFSNKLKPELARHLAFWLCFLVQAILTNVPVTTFSDLLKFHSYHEAVISTLPEIPVCIFSVYIFLYFLFPLLQKKKYARLFFSALIVLFFNCVIELFVHLALRPYTCKGCSAVTLIEKANMIENVGINLALFFSMLAFGIKFAKHWYRQQINNRLLAGQKVTNQLKLLKSRIQPEFLFASLDDLYSKISIDKNQAVEILFKLSQLLSYMLYENNNDIILVQRELLILQEFISLENLVQNKKINFINGVTNNLSKKYIPSFTLLSLIQNVAILLRNDAHNKANYLTIQLQADNDALYCTMHIHFENASVKTACTGIIHDFTNRLQTFYKNNYRLDFNQHAENKLKVMLSLLFFDDLSAYKIEEAFAKQYIYATE